VRAHVKDLETTQPSVKDQGRPPLDLSRGAGKTGRGEYGGGSEKVLAQRDGTSLMRSLRFMVTCLSLLASASSADEGMSEQAIRQRLNSAGVSTAELSWNAAGGWQLRLHRMDISDLSFLSGLPLSTLHIGANPVEDLAPLKGMPLRTLTLSNTLVTDLSPLQGMQLEVLLLDYVPATNYAPLKGMPLRVLMAEGAPVADIRALRGMPITQLWLTATKVQDLSSLAGAPLDTLGLNSTPVRDLAPLQGSPVQKLYIDGTQVTDLSPLRGCTLTSITFSPARITNGMEALRSMASLQTISTGWKHTYSPKEFWNLYDRGALQALLPKDNPPLPENSGRSNSVRQSATEYDYQAVVDALRRLQDEADRAFPKRFDPNTYFTHLRHVSMEPGYRLAYVYWGLLGNGRPYLYAHPTNVAPFKTYAEYEAALGGWEAVAQHESEFLAHIRADGTKAGIFELVLLSVSAGQFHLYWHDGYNDARIVCDKGAMERTLTSCSSEGFGNPITTNQAEAARGLTLEPRFSFSGETGSVAVVTFKHWGGFHQKTYTFKRAFPHKVEEAQSTNVVPYSCGIVM
jgi:hypothetical protein